VKEGKFECQDKSSVKTIPVTVEDIVRAYLSKNGYDGLCSYDRDCGCSVSNLAPCGEIGLSCMAAKSVSCSPSEVDEFAVCSGCGMDIDYEDQVHFKPEYR